MRKYSLLLAVMLAASFSTVADAAKKKAATKAAADPVYEWNIQHMKPPQGASTAAAQPGKAAKKMKKKAKKSARKSSKKRAKKA